MAIATAFKNVFKGGRRAVRNVQLPSIRTTAKVGQSNMFTAAASKSQKMVDDVAQKATQASKPLVNRKVRNSLVNAGLVTGGVAGAAYLGGKGLGSGISDVGSGVGAFIDDVTGRVSPNKEIELIGAQTELLDAAGNLKNESDLPASNILGSGGASQDMAKQGSTGFSLLGLAALGGIGYLGYKAYKKRKGGKTKK